MGLFNLYISHSLLWVALRGGPYSSCTGKASEAQRSKVPPKLLQQMTKGQDSELGKPDSQGPLFASSPPGRPTSLWGCQTLPLEAQPNASSAGKVPGTLQPAATLPPLPRRAVTIHLVHAQPGEQMPLAGSPGRAHLTTSLAEMWAPGKVAWHHLSAQYGAWHGMEILCAHSHALRHHRTHHHTACLSPPSPQA